MELRELRTPMELRMELTGIEDTHQIEPMELRKGIEDTHGIEIWNRELRTPINLGWN